MSWVIGTHQPVMRRWSLFWHDCGDAVGNRDANALRNCGAAKGEAASPDDLGDPSTHDPRKPGDHRAAAEYYYRTRLGPDGEISGAARANAFQQAQALPKVQTLPAAIGGKGPPVGKDGLAPPSALWQQLGPANIDMSTYDPLFDFEFGHVSGRATAIAIGPHTGVIYLGTADGGVWKSTNDGASWTPLTDNQPSLAIGSLALDLTDVTDNTLYAGTGETNYDIISSGFNGDSYFGVGILKTTNGGTSWIVQGVGLPNFNSYSGTSVGIGALVANGATVLAGTTKGLYRSTDSGATWTKITVAAGFPNARVTEVIMDGTNVYTVLSETNTGLSYAGIYKSTTGGAASSFNPIMTGLPTATTWGRAQVAIARSTPLTLYLSIAQGANSPHLDGLLGIFKTTNGGTNWAATTTQPPNYLEGTFSTVVQGQGFYDQMIAVDPADPNLVYGGGVNVVVSTNGGGTWAKLTDVYCGGGPLPCGGPVHPDNHAAAFGSSGTPRPLYLVNDGGIFKTTNANLAPSATFSNLNSNLATLQFYGADVANDYSTTPVVIAGSQDNGTARTASTSLSLWNGLLGGDGGFVAIDKTDPNTVYASNPDGFIKKATNANAGSSIAWTASRRPIWLPGNRALYGPVRD